MGYILVDARMPYGDHIETRDFDRRLAHDQSFVAGAQQAGWKECHKIPAAQHAEACSHQQRAWAMCWWSASTRPGW